MAARLAACSALALWARIYTEFSAILCAYAPLPRQVRIYTEFSAILCALESVNRQLVLQPRMSGGESYTIEHGAFRAVP